MSAEYHVHTLSQEAARDAFASIFKLTDFQVIGRDKLSFLQEKNHSAIFAFFPHTGHLDSPAVREAIPPELRKKLLYPAAADYWHQDGVGGKLKTFMSTLVVPNFPMYRQEAGMRGVMESLKQAAEFLKSGYLLVISPEGTRSNLPLRDRQLRTGIAELALMTGKPIIPTGLIGMEKVLPKGEFVPNFRDAGAKRMVKVVFGEAIYPTSLVSAKDNRKQRREITAQLKESLIWLCSGSELKE
jgi:1-acyl-sn-glycerol-3-phosphate acyltransferase